MKRRAFVSRVGATIVAPKQGEGRMNRIAVDGVLLTLALPATAGPDALGCFTRPNDRANLAQHPDKVVTPAKLGIYRPTPANAGRHWFVAEFAPRRRDETLRTTGVCHA